LLHTFVDAFSPCGTGTVFAAEEAQNLCNRMKMQQLLAGEAAKSLENRRKIAYN
jgi:hypothetical protein